MPNHSSKTKDHDSQPSPSESRSSHWGERATGEPPDDTNAGKNLSAVGLGRLGAQKESLAGPAGSSRPCHSEASVQRPTGNYEGRSWDGQAINVFRVWD